MASTRKNTTKAATVNTLEIMARPLATMHRLNNKKVISSDFMDGIPTTAEVTQDMKTQGFKAWIIGVKAVYTALQPWAEKFNDRSVTDAELDEIWAGVLPAWQKLNTVCKYVWIRDNDVRRLCGFMMKSASTSKGTVDTLVPLNEFRRSVETMIGIRMAQTALLSADDYAVIKKYDSAVATRTKAQIQLDGSEETEGLNAKLANAQAALDAAKDMIKALGVKAKDVENNELLTAYNDNVTSIEDQIARVNGQIAKADDTIGKLQTKYDDIMAKVNEITLP